VVQRGQPLLSIEEELARRLDGARRTAYNPSGELHVRTTRLQQHHDADGVAERHAC
jgi:hypothetical protein